MRQEGSTIYLTKSEYDKLLGCRLQLRMELLDLGVDFAHSPFNFMLEEVVDAAPPPHA